MKLFKRIQYNSPVILTFALISLAALLVGFLTDDASTRLLFSIYRSQPTDLLVYIRVFTHVLGHISFSHYFNNFLIILLIGPMLEEKYGARNIIFMIILTAFVTGIINLAFFQTALLGASGVAFMFILLGSYVNLKKGRVPVTLILIIVIFIGREVIDGLYMADNISRISHIAGGLCGALLGFFLNKDKLIVD